MRKNLLKISLAILAIVFWGACGSDDNIEGGSVKAIGGSQSEFGLVGTSFTLTNLPSQLQGATIEITENAGGVSTLRINKTFSDAEKQQILSAFPNYNGTSIFTGKFRATSEGIQSVYDDGSNFTLVKYDASVGDTYTAVRNGHTITRTVTQKSSTDDYYWGGMLIKTITVEETGRNLPGVNKTVMYYNHNFGFVGYEIHAEDGSKLINTNIDFTRN
jgi:hypothetical protein